MVKRKRAGLVKVNNLPLLQNLIRRDPASYQEEFLLQYRHYGAQRDIFVSIPMSTPISGDKFEAGKFSELIDFIAHVSSCYPMHTKTFPDDLANMLANHATLHPELREKLVQSLVLLRNKYIISSPDLLKVLFPILTTTKSKALRAQIYTTIISEMRNANAEAKNHTLNKTVQTVLFGLVEAGKEDSSSTAGLWAVKITRELWKRSVWGDGRTVEIMKEAALSRNPKVLVGAVKFFLGVDQEREEVLEGGNSDDDGLSKHVENLRKGAGISKTNKKKRQLEKAVATLKRKERSRGMPHLFNFSALHLLHDPQGFAEQLYSMHLSPKNSKLSLENKLIILQLVTRLVGLHKLELPQIYSFMLKYLTPRQREVTHFLACVAQASHALTPPDTLEPLVRKIADEFVSDGVASEIATVGLNAIREICARAPLAMTPTLLQDLTEYKGSSDRGVMMAARSLIALYRELAPEMLKRKDRGKTASMEMKENGIGSLRYGEEKAGVIEGLELLAEWKAEQRRLKAGGENEGVDNMADEEDDQTGWYGWDVESDDDSDSQGWVNVESDEELVISYSEDEGKATKKVKLTDSEHTKTGIQDESSTSSALQGGGEQSTHSLTDEQPSIKETVHTEEICVNSLATRKILTPEDFAKLSELRTTAALSKLTSSKKKPSMVATINHTAIHEEAITSSVIARTHAPVKATKEEKVAKVLEGREDREKFGSSKHKKLDEKVHSTTNKEKQRKKNFLMTLASAKRRQRRGLVEKGRQLKSMKMRQGQKKK